jgi:hypothetical protein
LRHQHQAHWNKILCEGIVPELYCDLIQFVLAEFIFETNKDLELLLKLIPFSPVNEFPFDVLSNKMLNNICELDKECWENIFQLSFPSADADRIRQWLGENTSESNQDQVKKLLQMLPIFSV